MRKLVWQNANGEEINLTSGDFGITNWEGFSNAPLNIQSQQVPFQDGSVFLDALIENRELNVTLAIQDGNDLEKRYQYQRQLNHALNPKLGEGYLFYTNDYISKRIKCIPQIPLFPNKNSNDSGTQKASLSWTACEPYWEDLEEKEVFFNVGELPVINNKGDVSTQMQIEFFGTSEKSEIQNITTGKKIEVDAEIGDGIVINTNNGEKSVTKENLNVKLLKNCLHIYSVCYSKKLSIFVGVGEAVKISSDGINWNTYVPYHHRTLYSITYSESLGLFVAVGASGTILTSSDGITWTSRTSGVSTVLYSIIYSENLNLFVVVGNNGTILTSPDGITWTSRTSDVSTNLKSIAYSESLGLFVAVGNGGTILTSSDGITWTSRTSGVSTVLYSIIYSDELNLFVAVGASGTILTSSDGITWTNQTSGVSTNLKSIAYSESLGLFVVVGGGGESNNVTLTSPDGINWTVNNIQNISRYNPFCNVFYCNYLNMLVISCEDYSDWSEGLLLTSNDGVNLKIRESSIGAYVLYSIAYSESLGLFVAVGSEGVYTSLDEINWNLVRHISGSGQQEELRCIYFSEEHNLFVAVGMYWSNYSDAYGLILTSSDGINWTRITIGSDKLLSVCYSKKLSIFVVSGWGRTIITSSDGINWTKQYGGFSNNPLNCVIYSEEHNLFVAVGYTSTANPTAVILISPDGINWTEQVTGLNNRALNSVCYSKNLNLFIAVQNSYGSWLHIFTSKNGMDWVEKMIRINSATLYSITYSESLGLFVAVGINGVILKSLDGINWEYLQYDKNKTALSQHFINYFKKLDYFISVGQDGLLEKIELLHETNIIQHISSDSDMNMNLQLGENQFRLIRENGSLFSRIKYRQKYIGV